MQNFILFPAAAMPALEAGTALGGSTGPDLSRYFLVCAILIVMMVGVAWGLRRLVAGNVKFRASQRSLRVVDVLAMGGRRKLAVVRCYDRTFVLGLGEKEITAIAELDSVIGSEPVAEVPRKSDQTAFAEALEQIRKVMPQKPVAVTPLRQEDIVAPTLSRKMAKRKAPATQPAPAARRWASPIGKPDLIAPKRANDYQPRRNGKRQDAEPATGPTPGANGLNRIAPT